MLEARHNFQNKNFKTVTPYLSSGVLVVAIFLTAVFSFFIFPAGKVLASNTDGTVDSTYKFAWGENIGWVNFGVPSGDVHITDAGLSGYAWSDNYGWINLKPPTSGVKNNNGNGVLSGDAWAE